MQPTSSGKGDAGAGCLSPPCTNTSAWVNLEDGNVNAGYLRNAITGAGAGNCPAATAQTGNYEMASWAHKLMLDMRDYANEGGKLLVDGRNIHQAMLIKP